MSEEGGEDKRLHKVILAGLGLLVVLILAGLHLGFGPRWYEGYQPEQPIPFSHAVHAGQYQMPCLYCHSSAEYAAHSSVPGLETCMNCHQAVKTDSPWIQKMQEAYDNNEPIEWVEVHVLPDFVQFNHRAHVAANIPCQHCHGDVENMEVVYQWAPLSMGWCVDCHRSTDFVTEERRTLLTKKLEMQNASTPPFNNLLMGHDPIQNADVSCSTCHY